MMKQLFIVLVGCLQALFASAQPEGVTLDTLHIRHIDFQGKTQTGILICNKKISNDLQDIFAELYKAKYPIERIRPISEYQDDDERSMRDNNTSCYCYRVVACPWARHRCQSPL